MITAATIRRIREFDAGSLRVVSMYLTVPVDPRERNGIKTRLNSLLEFVRPLDSDESLCRAARLSIREDIERIEELSVREHWKPPAIALFSCAGKGLPRGGTTSVKDPGPDRR
jgi:peptide chain release factor subunit 1